MNFNNIKNLTTEELFKIIPVGFNFVTKPWKHQIACFLATLASLENKDGFLDCLDLGTGKTKIAIDVIRYLQIKENRKLRILVVCLNSAVENWKDEIKQHAEKSYNAFCIRGNYKQKDAFFRLNEPGFYIVNFEGLRAFLVQGRGENRLQEKSDLSKKLIELFYQKKEGKSRWDVLIIDESHKIKSKDSLNFKCCFGLATMIPYRMLLTGTPFGNTLLDIWAQYQIIDFGKTFSPSYWKFRKTYFTPEYSYWGYGEWKIKKGAAEAIREKMFTKAIRYTENEIDELPEKIYRVIKYDLDKEQLIDYETAFDKFIKKEADPILGTREKIFNIQNRTMVFRQICGGFIKSINKIYKQNPKLNILQELIEQIVEDHKLVIFHEFIQEGLFIEQLLESLKIRYNKLNGSVSDKHWEYTTFNDDEKYRVMVAHPLSGGASINLVSASYCIFFSNGYKIIDRRQCEKRIHRAGQKAKTVFYYDFIGNETIEETMVKNLTVGLNAFNKILNDKDLIKIIRGEKRKCIQKI